MSAPRPSGGVLLIDKPQGLTSNQVLGRIKRLFGIKKAGHTGTLDPMATGLLVVCVGHATRIAAHLTEADKAYRARLHLGVVTDTEDAEGTVVDQRPVPSLTPTQINDVLAGFVGAIEQVPPMYSALKHQGQRLYALARAGEVVDRPPRPVRIDRLAGAAWRLDDPTQPGFDIEVHCSKGTYIRSLVRDIGERLGCGAHLCQLERTWASPFALSEAVALDALEQMDERARQACLRPVNEAVPDWPVVALSEEQVVAFRHGRAVAWVDQDTPADAPWVCVVHKGVVVGLAQVEQGQILPRAVFNL